MKFEKTKIYGVRGVGNAIYGGEGLPRTDDAVGLTYRRCRGTIGGATNCDYIVSDFDTCYPWCDIQEVTDEFGNIFIKIPKFYAKITESCHFEEAVDGDVYEYQYQISGCRYAGFSTLFIDGKGNEIDYVLIGKYRAGTELRDSMTYLTSKRFMQLHKSSNISTARQYACNMGTGYQQYDFLIDNILKLLFTVEFAATQTSSVLAYGNFQDEALEFEPGESDSISYVLPGLSCSVDGVFALYRGIEHPFGNEWLWCDGVFFGSQDTMYVCVNPADYTNNPTGVQGAYCAVSWHYVGQRLTLPIEGSTAYVRIQPLEKFPLLQFPVQSGAGDYVNESMDVKYYYENGAYGYNAEGSYLCCGGCYSGNSGMWTWSDDTMAALQKSGSDQYMFGSRLCYKPI